MAQHFDLAAFEVVVGGAFGTRTHNTLNLYTKLIAHNFGCFKHVSAVRVADNLHVTFPVSQVNENHAAVVSPTIYPAAKAHGLAQLSFGHQTAIVRTHLRNDSHKYFYFQRNRATNKSKTAVLQDNLKGRHQRGWRCNQSACPAGRHHYAH